MRRRFWDGDRRNKQVDPDGVADIEAFLRGRLAERLEAQGAWVPTWAWTNLLAHGAGEDLRDHRSTPSAPQQMGNDQWRSARAYLATEVLLLASVHGPLVVLQERLLRPLELDLAVNPEAARWDPSEWVTHVSSILDAHRTLEQRTCRHGVQHPG